MMRTERLTDHCGGTLPRRGIPRSDRYFLLNPRNRWYINFALSEVAPNERYFPDFGCSAGHRQALSDSPAAPSEGPYQRPDLHPRRGCDAVLLGWARIHRRAVGTLECQRRARPEGARGGSRHADGATGLRICLCRVLQRTCDPAGGAAWSGTSPTATWRRCISPPAARKSNESAFKTARAITGSGWASRRR